MKILIAVLGVFFALNNLMAADNSSGCGPGWYIAKEQTILSSSTRATTNNFLMPTTTIGMTVGTSNCGKHEIVYDEVQSTHYIANNYYELKTEAALGNGMFLSAFAEVLGCDSNVTTEFISNIKLNYNNIFRYNHDEEKKIIHEIKKMISGNKRLSKSCAIIG